MYWCVFIIRVFSKNLQVIDISFTTGALFPYPYYKVMSSHLSGADAHESSDRSSYCSSTVLSFCDCTHLVDYCVSAVCVCPIYNVSAGGRSLSFNGDLLA